jgi:prophage tail gpP-like protein
MGALSQLASAAFGSGSSVPSLRRPVFEIEIGSGAAADWAPALVAFSVEAVLAPGVDRATILASPLDSAPSVSPTDSTAISAGYEDDSAVGIFQGQVDAVRFAIQGPTRIVAVNGGSQLACLRVNQGYEQRTAGDILSDLASRAGVDTDTIEDGVTYPYYVIDDGRSAWRHIAELARKNNFLAYFTTEGKLVFQPVPSGSPVQTFTYGQDILALDANSANASAGKVTAIGEGAAGTQGNDAWAWIVKDTSSVSADAGDGAPERLLPDASLRSADAVRRAAAGASAAFDRSRLAGRLLVPGAPAVTAGSIIEIAGAPHDSLNGSVLVERVCHRYSKKAGFTTAIAFCATGGGA